MQPGSATFAKLNDNKEKKIIVVVVVALSN